MRSWKAVFRGQVQNAAGDIGGTAILHRQTIHMGAFNAVVCGKTAAFHGQRTAVAVARIVVIISNPDSAAMIGTQHGNGCIAADVCGTACKAEAVEAAAVFPLGSHRQIQCTAGDIGMGTIVQLNTVVMTALMGVTVFIRLHGQIAHTGDVHRTAGLGIGFSAAQVQGLGIQDTALDGDALELGDCVGTVVLFKVHFPGTVVTGIVGDLGLQAALITSAAFSRPRRAAGIAGFPLLQ